MDSREGTQSLFGVMVHSVTYANISCEWCGTYYDHRENGLGDALSSSESIAFTHFGDKQVCQCCFAKVEEAVLEDSDTIVRWFIALLAAKELELKRKQFLIQQLKVGLSDAVSGARR